MDIPIKAEVVCSDGTCGRSTFVILKPDNEQVTHVVVEENSLSYAQRLVPIDQIVESTPQRLQLRCSKKELDKMDCFIETELLPGNFTNTLWPNTVAELPVIMLEHELVPAGELAIDRGSRVVATDGFIGHVDEFIIDPVNKQITYLVLREGHLWGQKEVTLPVTEIDRIEDDTIYLKLSKAEVEKLPKMPIHR
jgi:sporulation protein YlmC with PRC-barrel domain